MIRKLIESLLLGFLSAAIIVSYFERPLVDLFTPLRTWLMVPDTTVVSESEPLVNSVIPYKASKDGYYVNPWSASSIVNSDVNKILFKGCNTISSSDLKRFRIFVDYFIRTAMLRSYKDIDFFVWEFPIHYNYGLTPGWVSGMAQARIAKIFFAAGKCSSNEILRDSYNEYYVKVIQSFSVDVNDGGVAVSVPGGVWYEEYAQPGVSPPLVLNGHVYAVQDLYVLGQFDDKARDLAIKGLDGLNANLSTYDALTWSFYDSKKTPANNIYQQALHARQMKELYHTTGESIYKTFYLKFNLQRAFPFSSIQRYYFKQTNFLGFLLFVTTGVLTFCIYFVKSLLKKRYAN